MPRASRSVVRARLRDFGAALPGAYVDHPWGETVVKVNKKIFLFLGLDEGSDFGLGVKLATSHPMALAQEGVEPMGYNLGKSGWVSVKLKDAPPEPILREWIVESYRAVAPKKLAAELDGAGTASPVAARKVSSKRGKS